MNYKKVEVTEKIMMEYAVKGFTAQIEKLEREIFRGRDIILSRNNGIYNDKSPLSNEGILKVIQDKEREVLVLDDMRSQVNWDLMEKYS